MLSSRVWRGLPIYYQRKKATCFVVGLLIWKRVNRVVPLRLVLSLGDAGKILRGVVRLLTRLSRFLRKHYVGISVINCLSADSNQCICHSVCSFMRVEVLFLTVRYTVPVSNVAATIGLYYCDLINWPIPQEQRSSRERQTAATTNDWDTA